MKIKNHFSLTAFIKNVQSITKTVGLFVQSHWWEIVILIGLVSKGLDIYSLGFLVPIYVYTDFFQDLNDLFRGLFCTKCTFLRRRVQFCALNFNWTIKFNYVLLYFLTICYISLPPKA